MRARPATDRGSLVSAPPDQAPQSQAHLYYFLAPTKRPYRVRTNLRTPNCHFPTSSCFPTVFVGSKDRDQTRASSWREERAKSRPKVTASPKAHPLAGAVGL